MQYKMAATAAQTLRARGWRLDMRYQIVLCCFFATFSAYVERVGFSIAFTAMAQAAELDESVTGAVLSAFFWGYALSQIPGGWAAQLYGGRLMLVISFICWSTVSILTPSEASNVRLTIIARVLVGVSQGFLIPAVHTVLSQWIPPHERARAVSLATSGMYLGSAAAMLILPAISAKYGAASLLKVDGGLGLTWLVLWILIGREIPHRETVMPLTNLTSNPSRGRPAPTPWGRMFRSWAIWAIVINNFAFHYAFYVVMNWLPTYFNKLLDVDLAQLGSVKTLPYLLMFGTSNLGGWMGDWLITKCHWSVARARKMVNTLGFVSSCTSVLLLPFAEHVSTGLLFTSFSLSALGLSRGGFSVNHMDIAPRYAGIVMGFSNTAGTLAGVIGVAATGVLLDWSGGASNASGWLAVHGASASVCGFAMLVFNTFARGEKLMD